MNIEQGMLNAEVIFILGSCLFFSSYNAAEEDCY
jgi:hypothetical protein